MWGFISTHQCYELQITCGHSKILPPQHFCFPDTVHTQHPADYNTVPLIKFRKHGNLASLRCRLTQSMTKSIYLQAFPKSDRTCGPHSAPRRSDYVSPSRAHLVNGVVVSATAFYARDVVKRRVGVAAAVEQNAIALYCSFRGTMEKRERDITKRSDDGNKGNIGKNDAGAEKQGEVSASRMHHFLVEGTFST